MQIVLIIAGDSLMGSNSIDRLIESKHGGIIRKLPWLLKPIACVLSYFASPLIFEAILVDNRSKDGGLK